MGPQGVCLGLLQEWTGRPVPLGPATLSTWRKGRGGPHLHLSGLCHPCPSCPGSWRKERDGARAGRGSYGACSCPGSTEKPDAVHESRKQAGEKQGGMWKGQLNPRSHSVGPTVHGQEGCQETREDFPVPLPHLSPNPVQTDPHWALGGSNCPTPSRGQHQAI